MAKSMFSLGVSGDFPKESILEVAQRIFGFLVELKKRDSLISSIAFVGKNDNDLHFLNIESSDESNRLALLFLDKHRKDIAKYEKEKNPTTNFLRDFGFSGLFKVFCKEIELFSITSRFGSSDGGGISITYFNRSIEKEFNWYHSTFELMVDYFDPKFGGIYFSNTAYINLFAELRVRYHIGWINYFSNSFELAIPNDLEYFEYIFTNKGKYLILSREDITKDKDTYEFYRSKLLETMRYLKKNVNGFARQ